MRSWMRREPLLLQGRPRRERYRIDIVQCISSPLRGRTTRRCMVSSRSGGLTASPSQTQLTAEACRPCCGLSQATQGKPGLRASGLFLFLCRAAPLRRRPTCRQRQRRSTSARCHRRQPLPFRPLKVTVGPLDQTRVTGRSQLPSEHPHDASNIICKALMQVGSHGRAQFVIMRSSAGKRLFGEAVAAGGMEGFFPLIEQFRWGCS